MSTALSSEEPADGISFTQTNPLEVSKVYGDMTMTFEVTVKVAKGDIGYYNFGYARTAQEVTLWKT